MVRTTKPYQRPDSSYKRGNPDTGSWKHDLHQDVKSSLASRLSNAPASSSSSRGGSSLLARISGGKGKELLPTASSSSPKLHGFGEGLPLNTNHPNAGLELLPGQNASRKRGGGNIQKGRLVENGLNAALGLGGPRRSTVRPLVSPQQSFGEGVSIMGAARGTVWVRVENLATGTTGEDVMSAFAPAPVLSARNGTSTTPRTTTVEIEVENRQSAEEIVSRYNGVVADGNTLIVTILKPNLAERFGVVKPAPVTFGGRDSNGTQAELIPNRSSSKMYSDTILASDPRSGIITLADDSPAARNQRAEIWSKSRPSLAERVGGGRR